MFTVSVIDVLAWRDELVGGAEPRRRSIAGCPRSRVHIAGAVAFSGDQAKFDNLKIGNIDADPLFVDPGFWENNGTPGILGRRIVIQDKQLRSSE